MADVPTPHAFLSVLHEDPISKGHFSEADVVVRLPHADVRLHILLKPPLPSHEAAMEAVRPLLADLGKALLRIQDQPSALYGFDPRQTRS